MKFDNKITMAIDDWKQYANDEDISLSYGNITFLSTEKNSHLHKYTEDVIKEYASSYLGKPIVAHYIKNDDDLGSHDGDDLKVVGYLPQNQKIKYIKDGDIFKATFDYVMFKLYARDVYEVIKRDGVKAVSLEQLVGFTEDTKDFVDGIKEKEVVGFEGIGITLLGLKYKPSIPSANIEMVQMSQMYVEKEYKKYIEHNTQDKILSKLCDIENILNKEDILMTKEEIKEDVVLEEVETVSVLAEDNTDDKTDDVNDKTDDTENKDDDEVEKMQIKLSELEKQIADYEAEKVEYETKIATLEKFKSDVEMAQKQEIIDTTMAKAKDLVKDMDFDNAKFEEYTIKGSDCNLDNIGTWKNSVMAEVAMFAIENKKEVKETTFDMGVPNVEKKYDSIYK